MNAFYKGFSLTLIFTMVILVYYNYTNRTQPSISSIDSKNIITSKILPDDNTDKTRTLKNDSLKNITDYSVLCIIMTSEKTFLERTPVVWDTWGKKCHKALFACNCKNITNILKSNKRSSIFKKFQDYEKALEIPIWQLNLTENYDHMADKVFQILYSAFKEYGHLYKWFLLTDDDTFVFVNNLHKFTSSRSYNHPATYGYNYKVIVPIGYHSGGGGTLLPYESMKRIANNIEKGVCNEKEGYGDVALGFCAYKSNLTLGNSLDDQGRERFHALDYIAHHKGHIPDWLRQYSSNGVKTGSDCCSDESITFHYTSPEQMKYFANLKDPKRFKEVYQIF